MILFPLQRPGRFPMHFTPTSSSWWNPVERWFREITEKRIRRGTFPNVNALIDAIRSLIDDHHLHRNTFKWTAKAETIREKVRRARNVLDKMTSA